MAEKNKAFSSIEQLEKLLSRYPNDELDIEGVILDYIGQTGEPLDKVFEFSKQIYLDLFTGDNAEKGKKILRCVVDPNEMIDLKSRCTEIYPNISKLLNDIKRDMMGNSSMALLSNPEEYLGHKISAVVWQISDIHFGKYNEVEKDPKDMAFLIAKIAADNKRFVPDVIVISGDISSIAKEAEFDQFKIFCRNISQALWGGIYPERILVIPGNHDTSWKTDGAADCMKSFSEHMLKEFYCITPFGNPNEIFGSDGNEVIVTRHSLGSDEVPPFAIVEYKKFNIEFMLFVSGFFSGSIPLSIRDLLTKEDTSREHFLDLLRIDEGAVNREYIFNIANNLGKRERLSIGVIHHNPIQYGVETCQNTLAPLFLETLFQRNIPLLFHGHVHLCEDKSANRPVIPVQSYPVPCPTISSTCTTGSGRGMNIHLVGEDLPTRRIETIVWNLSNSSNFNPDGVILRYKFAIKEGEVNVEHCARY